MGGPVAAKVLSVEPVAGKDKLSVVVVDAGAGAELKVVTNASNVAEGALVVVAPPGSVLRDGTEVAKAVVGGVASEGMLCDAPALGWAGGGAGAAALLPANKFAPGDTPPEKRPRMDGKEEEEKPAAAGPKPEDCLFEKKLSKEEKKALAAAKREAKKKAKEEV